MNNRDPRYPIGEFQRPASVSRADRESYIETIALAPTRLRAAVAGLNEDQLNTPYREGGWTIRQVIHHVPDSHLNSYVRFKLALTEDKPLIKPYNEAAWSELGDVAVTPIEVSLGLLDHLHHRWVLLLESLGESDWKREFRHPEIGPISLETNLALYAWHSNHHIAHITSLRAHLGWD